MSELPYPQGIAINMAIAGFEMFTETNAGTWRLFFPEQAPTTPYLRLLRTGDLVQLRDEDNLKFHR